LYHDIFLAGIDAGGLAHQSIVIFVLYDFDGRREAE